MAGGQRDVADGGDVPTVAFDDLAAQRLGEAERRLGDLLEEEMRRIAPVDVAGGDLGDDDVVVGEREVGTVVGEAPQTAERARSVGGHDHDLAAALAVEADVSLVSSTTPYGSLAMIEQSSARPT